MQDWECYCCKEKQVDSPCLQADIVEDNKILLSNYYEQRFIEYTGEAPPLNAPCCLKCVNQMPGLQNKFEKENDTYTFEMNGYTCRSTDKEEAFIRDCGHCVGCNTHLILRSLYLSYKYKEYFFILWSPHLASRCFPDACSPQVWKLTTPSKFYIESDKPVYLCTDCYKQESWKPCDGTITCPLCDKRYQRWVSHWNIYPVKYGIECDCHVCPELEDGKEVILSNHVEPEPFEWIGEKPENFDNNKFFCDQCLDQLVKDGILKSLFDTCSSEEDYGQVVEIDSEEFDRLVPRNPEEFEILKTLFPEEDGSYSES